MWGEGGREGGKREGKKRHVCVCGGGGGCRIINTRNSTSYDIRLSIYNDRVASGDEKTLISSRETSVHRIYLNLLSN